MRLVEKRAEKLLSIRELARKADIAERTVHTVETGMAVPSLTTVRKLIAALEVADPREIDEFKTAIDQTAHKKAHSLQASP